MVVLFDYFKIIYRMKVEVKFSFISLYSYEVNIHKGCAMFLNKIEPSNSTVGYEFL